jgi:hypothetical protein
MLNGLLSIRARVSSCLIADVASRVAITASAQTNADRAKDILRIKGLQTSTSSGTTSEKIHVFRLPVPQLILNLVLHKKREKETYPSTLTNGERRI